MKHCAHCGNELEYSANICPKCGCLTSLRKNNALGLAAKIILMVEISGFCIEAGIYFFLLLFSRGNEMILYCFIHLATALLPLAWLIPMTKTLDRKLNSNIPISTTFKVCTLIFCGVIPGILLLCRREDC